MARCCNCLIFPTLCLSLIALTWKHSHLDERVKTKDFYLICEQLGKDLARPDSSWQFRTGQLTQSLFGEVCRKKHYHH